MGKIKYLLLFVVVSALTNQIIWTSKNRITSNFYEVVPNELYRSAQLFPEELASIIEKHQIKTIINLRGAHTQSEWYLNEKSVAQKSNVTLIDVGMGTHHVPHKGELIKLIQTFKTAQKPILIHCRVGADRTGEAVALYQILQKNVSKEEALKSLSFKFWHVPFFTPSKTLFVENFSGEEWATNNYDPCKEPFKSYYLDGECR